MVIDIYVVNLLLVIIIGAGLVNGQSLMEGNGILNSSLVQNSSYPGCGSLLSSNTGVLASPNYPKEYSSNENCRWEISIETDKVILFEFEDFNIEENDQCSFDKLNVQEKDKDGGKWKTTATFCGLKTPASFRTQSNFVRLVFISDDSENRRGFKLKWEAISEQQGCGQTTFNTTHGTLTNIGFPTSYNNNLNCSYNINAPKSHQLILSINEIDIEYGSSCQYDFISIYDVRSTGKLILGKFCGNKPPRNDVISMGNQVLITFTTDDSTNGKGFNISWAVRKVQTKQGNRTCGLKYNSLRIVGGTIARKGEFPWQAGFFWRTGIAKGKFFCGGALVDSQWVLTAAHCFVNGENASHYKIVLGEQNLRMQEGHEQEMNILDIIVHPLYNMITYDNDLALVKLQRRAILNDYINTLCLPEKSPQVGKRCVVAGWGATLEHGRASDVLMRAEVPIIAANVCRHPDVYGSKITNNMLCAGYSHGGIDTCQGDSGGPLHCQSQDDPNTWEIQGIASWGRGCGRQMRYGVYTKVGNFLDWMRCVVRNSSEASSVRDKGISCVATSTKENSLPSSVLELSLHPSLNITNSEIVPTPQLTLYFETPLRGQMSQSINESIASTMTEKTAVGLLALTTSNDFSGTFYPYSQTASSELKNSDRDSSTSQISTLYTLPMFLSTALFESKVTKTKSSSTTSNYFTYTATSVVVGKSQAILPSLDITAGTERRSSTCNIEKISKKIGSSVNGKSRTILLSHSMEMPATTRNHPRINSSLDTSQLTPLSHTSAVSTKVATAITIDSNAFATPSSSEISFQRTEQPSPAFKAQSLHQQNNISSTSEMYIASQQSEIAENWNVLATKSLHDQTFIKNTTVFILDRRTTPPETKSYASRRQPLKTAMLTCIVVICIIKGYK